MNNSEVLELRKRLKKEDNTITKLTGCYVIGMEKQIRTYIDTTLDELAETEQFKYMDILKKGLSGVLGKNLLNLSFTGTNEEISTKQQELLAIRKSELKSKEMLDSFYASIIENYKTPGNYLILLIHDSYDVMVKTSDKRALDESEEIYEYILCCICPVNLAKPALSYHEEENIITDRERDWIVDMPDIAFLYPCFNDRSADVNHVLYYCKNNQDMHPELIEGVLGCGEEMTSDAEKEIFQQIVEDVINEAPEYDTFEVVRSINNNLTEMVENKVFGDEPTIDKTGMKELMKKSGVRDEHLDLVEEKFEKEAGEHKALRVENLREKRNIEVKSGEMQIKVKPDAADLLEIRVIDGRKCIVIPMNSDIEVNGIMKRIEEELKEERNEDNKE